MTKTAYPVLCGGTFFSLLLEARKARSGKKEQMHGKVDGLSEPEVLAGLVRIMHPEFKEPSGKSTFGTNTAEYKACRNNGGNLPFFDKEIKAFDNRVKNDYQTALICMCEFINRFIEVGGSVKRDEWLVNALFDLVDKDQSIRNEDVFYICESGQAMRKDSFHSITTVCLPAFLLGIWHFAVVLRRDNTLGSDTFEAWCPKNGRKRREYKGTMGENITRILTATMPNLTEPEIIPDEINDEPYIDSGTSYEDQPDPTPPPGYTTQIINSPALFFNTGANGVQVNNTGTLNIVRGA